jgi:MFS family permease
MSLAIFGQAEQDKATAMGFYQAVYSIGMFMGPVAAGKIGGWLGYTDAVLEFRLCCGHVNSCSIEITQIDPHPQLSSGAKSFAQ